MAEQRSFVIVGASLAGAKAAETLRAEGFDGRVVLVGEESFLPYERPPLSKDFLRGESPREKAYVHPEGFYAEQGIELILSRRATALDISAAEVVLEDGERIRYDSLLLATGSQVRRLTVPGAERRGVHYLRTLPDSEALGKAIRGGGRVAVIGAGWIGCEVAASARQMGAEVVMIDLASLPLERVLGTEMGSFYRQVHVEHGVELRLGVGVAALLGGESVEAVELADGSRVEADMVVAGVGVTPRVELAEQAGLALDNGVVTDAQLTTSVLGVFAAGDVANAWHPVLGRRVRLEHWSSALNHGPVAARNMLGQAVSYTKLPYFYSDQYDVGMEYSGLAAAGDEVVVRGSLAERRFIAFWVKDGRVTAGMNVNIWDVAGDIAQLVEAAVPVDRGRLADPDVPLSELLPAGI
ncbi:MAG TPA: FAD-dependent oxidoreductase [Acidimicrobiales bacterium]|nr:FAD-dependent oxidoreductase [Acidimicrobiales bacterium]